MSIVEYLSQPLWQRLGLTLVHFLWQGLAVAVLVGVFVRMLRLKHGNARYGAYLLAFIAMIACPVVTFTVIDIDISANTEPVTVAEPAEVVEAPSYTVLPAVDVLPEAATARPAIPTLADSISLGQRISNWLNVSMPWVLVIWMAGVIVLSVRLLMGFVGVYRWRHHLEALPERLVQRIASLSEGLGMRRFSRVFISPTVLQAMAVGYLRPMVLLPAAMVTQMQPEMLEAVIAHELAHIRRFDLWINLIQRITETLLFYHPAVWWLSNCIRRERELCCDELAVKATGQRLTYASTLESIGRARFMAKQPVLAAGLGRDNKPTLSRVRHILGLDNKRRDSRFWQAGVIAVLLIMALVIPTGLALTARSEDKSGVGKSEHVDVETLLNKVRQAQRPTTNMIVEWQSESPQPVFAASRSPTSPKPDFSPPSRILKSYKAIIAGDKSRIEERELTFQSQKDTEPSRIREITYVFDGTVQKQLDHFVKGFENEYRGYRHTYDKNTQLFLKLLLAYPPFLDNPKLSEQYNIKVIENKEKGLIILETSKENTGIHRFTIDPDKDYNIVKQEVIVSRGKAYEINCIVKKQANGLWYQAAREQIRYSEKTGKPFLENKVTITKLDFNPEIPTGAFELQFPKGIKIWDGSLKDWIIAGDEEETSREPAVQVEVEKTASNNSGGDSKRYQLVTFREGMSIREALRFLGKAFKKNIIPSEKVAGQVPVNELYNVTFEEAVQAILGTHKYIVDGKFIRVYTEEEFESIYPEEKTSSQVGIEKSAVPFEGTRITAEKVDEASSESAETPLSDLPQEVRAAVEKLWSTDTGKRSNAVMALRYMGMRGKADAAVPYLIDMLGDDNKYPEMVLIASSLSSLTHSCSPTYTFGSEAAETIARIGKKSDKLLTLLESEDWNVRADATRAVGGLKDTRAADKLIAFVRDKNEHPYVKGNAALALGLLKDDRAVAPLIGALNDDEAVVRRSAASALGDLGGSQAAEPLMALLADRDAQVRMAAAGALGGVKESDFIPALLEALGDEHRQVREVAAGALSRQPDTRSLEPLIKALSDSYPNTRARAAVALGKLKDARVFEPLIAALKDDNEYVREHAATALGDLKDSRAVKPLIAVAMNDKHIARIRAIGALGKLGDSRAIDALIDILKDNDTVIRRNARDALIRITQQRYGPEYDVWKSWWDRNKADYVKSEKDKPDVQVEAEEVWREAVEGVQLDVLGFCVCRGERCTKVLEELRRRGLEDVKLFVSDESVAIGAALERVYPLVGWQHCTFHRLSKLRVTIGAADYSDAMVEEAACIFRCESFEGTLDVAGAWCRRWRRVSPWAVEQFLYGLRDSLRFYEIPKRWWKRIRTNNPLERLIRTLRDRLRPMGCFHNEKAIERAVFGQLLQWQKIKLTHNT